MQRVISLRANLALRQLEWTSRITRLPVETFDELADGRLQSRRVVHFKNYFPPRRRQHRTIERESYLASQRRGDVIDHPHTGLGFKLLQVLLEVLIPAADHLEHLFQNALRILDDQRAHHARVGRNELQTAHGSRRSQPRRNTSPDRKSVV